MRKTRPALVVSSDSMGRLPIKLIAPFTDWKDEFAANSWHVRVEPDATNGLTKTSALDVLQCRGADTTRFVERLGHVRDEIIEPAASAIALLVEYTPRHG